MGRSDDAAVLEAARAAIREARRWAPDYGVRGAGTGQISKLLVGTNTVLVERRFESSVKGMAFARLGGGHVIAIDTACSHADEIYTVRHELAHVLRGEITEPTYLTSEDRMSHAERVADLFAIADLAPAGWLRPVARGRPVPTVTAEVVQLLRALTAEWSDCRLWDRARLRVQLFRRHRL